MTFVCITDKEEGRKTVKAIKIRVSPRRLTYIVPKIFIVVNDKSRERERESGNIPTGDAADERVDGKFGRSYIEGSWILINRRSDGGFRWN